MPRTPPLDLEAARLRFRAALGLDKPCALCLGASGDFDVREAPTPANETIRLCRPCAKGFHQRNTQQSDSQCAACKGQSGDTDVRPESSRTMYHWDGKGEDPNASIPLCRPCAEAHHKEMDGRWGDYYSGLMG